MNLIQVITALAALNLFNDRKLDYPSAHKLMLLRRQLAPHRDFYAQKEWELVLEYAELDERGEPIVAENGTFKPRDPDSVPAFDLARMRLNAVELDEPVEKVKLKLPNDMRMTLAEIEALACVIDFEYEEG